MLLRISVLLAATLYGSCMEMRETVERMVMVRTSGSDLQPAATGYIYKKKNDGQESVIEMGESEVMEQLAKYYKPKSVASNKAEIKDASKDERVIPVSEESEEKVDGLANDDFKKIFEKYGVDFHDDGYDHYPQSLADFDGYHVYGGNDKENKKGYDDYKNHQYGNGGTGDYHNEKYESFTHSHKGNDEKGSDDHKKYNNKEDNVNKQEKSDAGHKDSIRFQKAYDNDQKDRKFYDHDDGVKFAFYKYGGNKYYGDDTEHKHGDSHESDALGKAHKENREAHSAEEQNDEKNKQFYNSNGGQTYGKSFGFKIEH